MDRKTVATPFPRREFLKRAGLATGGLLAGSLACGRSEQCIVQPAPTVPTVAASPSVTATSLPPPATPLPSDLAAEVLLLNGKIITVDPADAIAQAVAIKDRRIQAVGTDAEIAPLAGERTQVIDLGARAVTPGLIDAHNHFQIMGLTWTSQNQTGLNLHID